MEPVTVALCRRQALPRPSGAILRSDLRGKTITHIGGRSSLRGAFALGVFLLPALASAPEGDAVAMYTPDQAMRHSYNPIAYMVDETTCERVEGQRMGEGRLEGEGGRSALFRHGQRTRPFMRVTTRADSVYVARFQAQPGEVIYSRAYRVDPRSGRFIYGPPTTAICVEGKAEVGALTPIEE